MEFLVAVPGLSPFRYAPARLADLHPASPCRQGELCPTAARAGACLLPEAIAPVLDYFSQVVSHQPVLVTCRDAQGTAAFKETGQRAAFRLLAAALGHSPCPFFSRFFPRPTQAPVAGAYAAFARLAHSLALSEGQPETPDAAILPRLLVDAGRFGREIEEHLQPVLREAKRRCRLDAAVNGVIMLFSGSRLATEHLREARLGIPDQPRPSPRRGLAA